MPALTPRLELSKAIRVWASVTAETGLQYLATQSVVRGPADPGVPRKAPPRACRTLTRFPVKFKGPAEPQSLEEGTWGSWTCNQVCSWGYPSTRPLGSAE